MFVLYKILNSQLDPRHRVINTFWDRTLVEVADSSWINWEQGSPVIVPETAAKMYNFFGRPNLKGYQDNDTGEIYYSKGLATGKNTTKLERPFDEAEAADVVEYMKIVMTAYVRDIYQQRFYDLNKTSNPFEVATWPQQIAEGNAGGGVMLSAIAKNRGISVAELIAKVKEASADYNTAVGTLLGQQQRHIRDIAVCNTINEAAIVAEEKFGVGRHPNFGPQIYGDYKLHI
tara:strand:+ start:181 stop:873 length:693 start_codon:yes stop_codon:yes gene_type:complete